MAEGSSAVSSSDLQKLLTEAVNHCTRSDTVQGLYRNAKVEYFDELKDNTMMPSKKDSYGNVKCPINEKLEGVFFCVTLWNGGLPDKSPYGPWRVVVPLERLFDDSTNLYFADFYPVQNKWKNHYVILVLTKKDTEADSNCKKLLIQLHEQNNVFLWKEGSTYKTLKQDNVWVYVFYTDKVDISELDITDNFGNVVRPGRIRNTHGRSNVSGGGSEGNIESEARGDVSELVKKVSTLHLEKRNTDQPEK